MPVLDGAEATRRITAQADTEARPKIVALTATHEGSEVCVCACVCVCVCLYGFAARAMVDGRKTFGLPWVLEIISLDVGEKGFGLVIQGRHVRARANIHTIPLPSKDRAGSRT